jgi:hypothetical protein
MLDIIKNLNQEKIIEKGKPLGIAAICMTAVFVVGFGAGKLHTGVSQSVPAKRSLSNYNTNSAPTESRSATATNANTAANECPIKGSKSKIYHIQGGSFYERTNADRCFVTEADAQAAGYIKSSR